MTARFLYPWAKGMRGDECELAVHVHTLVHLGTVLLGLLSVMQHR
jgi:hypothetical protein